MKALASLHICADSPEPLLLADVLFVSFVALRPKPTAMVMVGLSVYLSTLFCFFLGKLEQVVTQNFVHILLLVTDNNPS